MEEDPESIGSVCKMTKQSSVYPKVCRLYNPYVPGGDHHYTTDEHEYEVLQEEGWIGEGVVFNCPHGRDASLPSLQPQRRGGCAPLHHRPRRARYARGAGLDVRGYRLVCVGICPGHWLSFGM